MLELEKVALQSDATRGLEVPSAVASYYESLFAFFIRKNDYMSLATEATSFKNRLMMDVEGTHSVPLAKDALSLAIHGLSCLDSVHAYVINARGEIFTTLREIESEFVELLCQYSVLSMGQKEYVTNDLISMVVEVLEQQSGGAQPAAMIRDKS